MLSLILLSLLCFISVLQASEPAQNYFLIQKGTMPIILTVPHGGSLHLPNLPQRRFGNTIADIQTLQLAQLVSDFICDRLRQKPYIIGAKINRKYIDFNRSKTQAFDQESSFALDHFYDAYHRYITDTINQVLMKYCQIILIDIHGQNQKSDAIFIGTDNGKTISHFLLKFGMQGFSGENSLYATLQKFGYLIYPKYDQLTNICEDPRFDGGYTIKTYAQNGIDAIQLEIGHDFRYTQEKRMQFARDLAEAIAIFYQSYKNYFIN